MSLYSLWAWKDFLILKINFPWLFLFSFICKSLILLFFFCMHKDDWKHYYNKHLIFYTDKLCSNYVLGLKTAHQETPFRLHDILMSIYLYYLWFPNSWLVWLNEFEGSLFIVFLYHQLCTHYYIYFSFPSNNFES